MALARIAVNIQATGVERTAAGIKTVESAVNSMGSRNTSVTRQVEANAARVSRAVGNSSTATGVAAAGIESMLARGAASVMRFIGTAALIAAPFIAAFSAIKFGISVMDDFQVSIIQIAAQLTQMQGPKNVAKSFQDSMLYARALASELEEIDANSFANNKGLMAMLQTMTMQGVVLDVNNMKQVESFTSLSNAIAMYTAGQDQAVQARQEMRALMTGEVNQHSQLSLILDAQIKQEGIYKAGLKEVVALGRQHGDTLERLSPYLVGVNAASESINKTWSAASSSMETAVNKITREGFAEAFETIVPLVSEMGTQLKNSSLVSEVINKTWLAGKGVVSAVVDILRGPMWVVLAGIGGLVSKIFDGWGLLLSSVLPVLADEFKHLISLLNAMVNMGMGFGLVMLDAVGAVGSAITSVGKAAFQSLTGDFEAAGKTLQGMFSGTYVERFKDNMMLVKGTAIAITEEWRAMQDPMGRMLDKADQYLAKSKQVKVTATAPTGGANGNAEDEKKAAEAAAQAYSQYASTMEGFNKQIRDNNPLLDQHEKNLQDVDLAVNKAISALPRYREKLLAAGEAVKSSIILARDYKEALDVQDTMTAAWEGEQKLREERAQNSGQLEIQLKEQQGLQREALALQIEMENAALREKGIYSGQVKGLKDKLDTFRQLNAEQQEAAELASLQRQNAVDAADLKAAGSSLGGATFSAIDDQLAADKVAIAARYEAERQLIEDKIELLQAGVDSELTQIDAVHKARMLAIEAENKARFFDQPAMLKQAATAQAAAEKEYAEKSAANKVGTAKQTTGMLAALNKALELTFAKERAAGLTADQRATKAKLDLASSYTTIGGQLFSALADTQDQSSRAGFESAKDYNLGAVGMNTATAIMAQLSIPGPVGWAGAAAATLMGAINYNKVNNTEYGGGGGAIASGGSFSGSAAAGGGYVDVGSSRGMAYVSVQDSQSLESMQRLADSVDNASIAMRKVADGLTEFSGMLSGGYDQSALGSADGRYTSLGSENGPLANLLAGMKTSITGAWKLTMDLFNDGSAYFSKTAQMLGLSTFFGIGNKWAVTGSGVSLGVQDGQLDGRAYTEKTKKGGWLTSDKHRTSFSELSDGFSYMLSGALQRIAANTNLAATVMGTSSNLGSVNIPQAKIATSGRSSEDIQKDVEAWLQKVGNEFAKTVDGLAAFAAPGEEAYAALIRLATSLQGANEQFALIGQTLLASTLQGADYASRLIELMGGTEAFGDSMDAYFTGGMFTQAQQDAALAAQATRQVTSAFNDMGRAVPATRQGFISLVNSLDLTTASGAVTFDSLMRTQGAFVTMTEAAEKAAQTIHDAYLDSALAAAGTLKEILSGPLSTLAPQERLMQQQAAFASALASGNDAALPGLGKSLLEISREMYGSGTGYLTDYSNVTSALANRAGIDGPITFDNVERQIQAISDTRQAIEDGTLALVGSLSELKAEIAELRRQSSANTAAIVAGSRADAGTVADAVVGTFAAAARA